MLEQGNPGAAAMVMMDLDNFKGINDRYGHDWGDEYLRRCARILEKSNGEDVYKRQIIRCPESCPATMLRILQRMEWLRKWGRFWAACIRPSVNVRKSCIRSLSLQTKQSASLDRKSTRLNSSHSAKSRMPSSA